MIIQTTKLKSADFTQNIILDNELFELRITWNTRAQKWFMDIIGKNKQNILLGIGLVPNKLLLRGYSISSLPKGDFYLYDSLETPEDGQPTYASLGPRYALVYFTQQQMLALEAAEDTGLLDGYIV